MIERSIRIPSEDPRLGRHVVHDDRSRAFPLTTTIDRSTWRDKSIRIYDPLPNPNQCHGECTGCAKMGQFNAIGNRRTGVVLGVCDAHQNYARNTQTDVWFGQMIFSPPCVITGTDTGSSGLASCKSAIEHGIGGPYFWEFRRADGIVENIMAGKVMSVGTRWDWNMFNKDSSGRIHLGGGSAGGHQWVARGYNAKKDWVLGRCWWGDFRDFWISRTDLNLLMDDWGDAHWQARA
jgi:hypothetical protein